MSLLNKLKGAGSIKGAASLADSTFFGEKEYVKTPLPVLNVAFSGSLNGGLIPGLTVIAGASKSFKSLLTIYCMKAYLDAHPDGIALFYDSEFGSSREYMEGFGIDLDRVLHVPITNIEEFKFDLVKRLQEIEKKDKVFIMVDSVGNLASKKEVEDAENEKSVADMTRAKSLKALFRIITPTLTVKGIPMVCINHIYMTQEMFSKPVVSGGTGIYYSANQIFIITKRQVKEGTEISGWEFVINIEKSRMVQEKKKLMFTVLYESGIYKWSNLVEWALESRHLVKPKVGWYAKVDFETGEIEDKNYRLKDIEQDEEWFEQLIADESFQKFVETKYKLTA